MLYKLKIYFFNISLFFKNPFLLALSLCLFTKKIKSKNKKDKINLRILILERRIFIDDIKALNNNSSNVEFFQISSRLIKNIYSRFLDSNYLNDRNYEVEISKFSKEQKKLLLFWKKILLFWKKIIKFDAVISANFIYCLQTELIKASININLPFYILFKEGLFPEKQLEYLFFNVFMNAKSYFHATKMFVYNERIKKLLLSVPQFGFTNENLIVTGIPRIDPLIKNYNENNKKLVTLFFSMPEDKFQFFDKKIIAGAVKKLDAFYLNFILLSVKHQDMDFVIKLKGNKSHFKYLEDLISKKDITYKDNLQLLSSDTEYILRSSMIVLSFSSTVLLEALVLNKVIVEPDLRDLIPKGWGLFDRFPSISNYVDNIQEMEKIMLNPEKYKSDEKQRNNILTDYFYKIDGNSSKRVLDIMLNDNDK